MANFTDVAAQILAANQEVKVVNESAEPIAELSNSKLDTYAKAATSDSYKKTAQGKAANASKSADDDTKRQHPLFDKANDRMDNVVKAYGKINKEKGTKVAGTEPKKTNEEFTYEIGDIVEDENGVEGVVTAITETEISIDWTVDGKIVSESFPLVEETTAASSLHPAARSIDDPKSKLDVITKVIGVLGKMEKDDLVDFFNKSIAQIGKEAENIPGGVAEKNKHTVDMKKVAKESIDELFTDDTLTEEFKEKATTLFESAVTARLLEEAAKLEEAYEEALNEELTAIYEDVNTKVDSYLEAASNKWLEENSVAVESALRNKLMENFIVGLKTLFEENYIDMPEEKVSVVESLIEKNKGLEARLDELMTVNSDLNDSLEEAAKEYVFLEASKGLPVDQIEKFAKLSESVDFEGSEDGYFDKLVLIREQHFNKKPATKPQDLQEEYIDLQEAEKVIKIDPVMATYSRAISRTV